MKVKGRSKFMRIKLSNKRRGFNQIHNLENNHECYDVYTHETFANTICEVNEHNHNQLINKFYTTVLNDKVQFIYNDFVQHIALKNDNQVNDNTNSMHVHTDECKLINYIPASPYTIRAFRKLTKQNTKKNKGYDNIILKVSKRIYFKADDHLDNNMGYGRINFVDGFVRNEKILHNTVKNNKIEKDQYANINTNAINNIITNTLIKNNKKPANIKSNKNNSNDRLIDFNAIFDDNKERRIGLFDITNISSSRKNVKRFKKEVILVKRYLRIDGDFDFEYQKK